MVKCLFTAIGNLTFLFVSLCYNSNQFVEQLDFVTDVFAPSFQLRIEIDIDAIYSTFEKQNDGKRADFYVSHIFIRVFEELNFGFEIGTIFPPENTNSKQHPLKCRAISKFTPDGMASWISVPQITDSGKFCRFWFWYNFSIFLKKSFSHLEFPKFSKKKP